jgi:hypothetical protein
MIETLIIGLLAVLAFNLLLPNREKHAEDVDAQLSNGKGNPVCRTDAMEIVQKVLGSKSINRRYQQHIRILLAECESHRLALARLSDSGPMIVINKVHDMSSLTYFFLSSSDTCAQDILRIVCHPDNFSTENVDTVCRMIAGDLTDKMEQ